MIDKCLARRLATGLSRFKRLQAAHLEDVFSDASRTADRQFLGAAAEHGWVVFTQNDKILKNPPEMAVIRAEGTKVFTLTNSHLGAEGGGLVFGRWILPIRRRIEKPGACFWRLYEERTAKDIK